MRVICIITVLLSVTILHAAQVDKNARLLKEKELELLKEHVQAARDSLQNEIATRWRIRQDQVRQREADKEELADIREKLERHHTELARLKEEGLSKNDIIEDENKAVESVKDEWKFIATSLDETFQKESDMLIESFPLDVEERKLELETIRRAFKRTGNSISALQQFADYRMKYHGRSCSVTFSKKTVLPNSGDPQELGMVRFGDVFVYGMNQAGVPYIIRQTGTLGVDRYSVETIGAPALRNFTSASVPGWIEKQKASGLVMFDVLQNAQSKILIAGEKLDNKQKFFKWVKSGGPVMFPLFGLLIWAILLTVWKLVQFMAKSGADKKLSRVILDQLSKNDIDSARKYVQNKRGVGAKIVRTCLEHSQWSRSSAEKAVKEILIDELPQINKHLNTLAVIAGAAPLMGLLGTVTGMIRLFEVITNYGTGDPKMLAGGISEALITTEVGLIIAIPVLLVHNFLRNRTNDLQAQMEKHAIRVLNRLWPDA
ncbi:MAG TPA: MotA/TolQ/ExbB proton channel family protein [Chitinispirillaceae bacterium]|nr:MotA/TolQ/ExbB proton channel family protein [Chitinispirillaceae bacterium]